MPTDGADCRFAETALATKSRFAQALEDRSLTPLETTTEQFKGMSGTAERAVKGRLQLAKGACPAPCGPSHLLWLERAEFKTPSDNSAVQVQLLPSMLLECFSTG